jgi:pimeloyl-ACP methyl ester carboxylesterase
MTQPRTFVLVHGAFHGGWCWSRVVPHLHRAGHSVLTPTQTGLGERRHLISRDITLDTFIQDVVNVLEAEDLTDVVLVGHSFGGISITGAADRVPERIRHLVYLDSRILEHGQTCLQVDPEHNVERRRAAQESSGGVSVPPPAPSFFGLPPGPDADWVARRMTPHPWSTMEDALTLRNPTVGNGLPCTYIACTDPIYPPLESCRKWARGRKGWAWREIATGHDAMVSAPEALAEMLIEIAA